MFLTDPIIAAVPALKHSSRSPELLRSMNYSIVMFLSSMVYSGLESSSLCVKEVVYNDAVSCDSWQNEIPEMRSDNFLLTIFAFKNEEDVGGTCFDDITAVEP